MCLEYIKECAYCSYSRSASCKQCLKFWAKYRLAVKDRSFGDQVSKPAYKECQDYDIEVDELRVGRCPYIKTCPSGPLYERQKWRKFVKDAEAYWVKKDEEDAIAYEQAWFAFAYFKKQTVEPRVPQPSFFAKCSIDIRQRLFMESEPQLRPQQPVPAVMQASRQSRALTDFDEGSMSIDSDWETASHRAKGTSSLPLPIPHEYWRLQAVEDEQKAEAKKMKHIDLRTCFTIAAGYPPRRVYCGEGGRGGVPQPVPLQIEGEGHYDARRKMRGPPSDFEEEVEDDDDGSVGQGAKTDDAATLVESDGQDGESRQATQGQDNDSSASENAANRPLSWRTIPPPPGLGFTEERRTNSQSGTPDAFQEFSAQQQQQEHQPSPGPADLGRISTPELLRELYSGGAPSEASPATPSSFVAGAYRKGKGIVR